jgi:hypothetical protein
MESKTRPPHETRNNGDRIRISDFQFHLLVATSLNQLPKVSSATIAFLSVCVIKINTQSPRRLCLRRTAKMVVRRKTRKLNHTNIASAWSQKEPVIAIGKTSEHRQRIAFQRNSSNKGYVRLFSESIIELTSEEL